MINTKIYKAVYTLAERLMEAVSRKDEKRFASYYKELEEICITHENTEKDHPLQWETLADFTDDLEKALDLYAKALERAVARDSKDHLSSIRYAMAILQIELKQKQLAIDNLKEAKISAEKIEDNELQVEIDELLNTLLDE